MIYDKLKAQDDEYLLHSYGRAPVAIKSGKGSIAEDYDGKKYIDFTSGIGVNVLGYCPDNWVNAVTAQLKNVQHVCNYYINDNCTELAEKLTKAAGMSRAFFCNSGAEANECAIKIARKSGAAKGKWKIITLVNSFHGRTLTTLAATGQDVFHRTFLPLTDGFLHVEGNDIEALKNAITDDVCAVMLEGVQGEGGVIPMAKEYLQAVRALCDEKDILMIMDEVQTGVGRTGYFYSYQSADILPDVATSAKGLAGGLPIGACLVSEKLKDIFVPSDNGSTFGGNPVVCAGAVEIVNTVADEAFLKSVQEKGAYITEKLNAMDKVSFVRGQGMIIGIKVENGMDAHTIMDKCIEKGLLILTAKGDMCRFLPPLNISYEDIDAGLKIFEEAINS
ncbi:MAG: aspartate aminotransferase family protein [Clostridia bacterium]|nr:aspartate aminotransferase family protein [Clostridia bacterium]